MLRADDLRRWMALPPRPLLTLAAWRQGVTAVLLSGRPAAAVPPHIMAWVPWGLCPSMPLPRLALSHGYTRAGATPAMRENSVASITAIRPCAAARCRSGSVL